MAIEAPVLIVGGSLNGLSLALFLAHRGVRCTLVERHPGTTVQYKFAGISPRSMEIYRGVGIEDEIRAHRTGDQKSAAVASARNLADNDVYWMSKPWADTGDLTAAPAATCDQDRLEPILRSHAERLGADVRFNTELVEFRQDDGRVTARIRDRVTGVEETVVASFLVGADGGNGSTRERLGIEWRGPGVLQHWMNLIFDSDLEPVIQGKPFTSCFVNDINGSLVPREDKWLLAVQYDAEHGERPEDFDQARTEDLVRRGAGREDVKVDLFDARPWDVAAYVAERFSERRVFIVGDAAHLMPPTGGFGGNTGIHDAHNLAWKLDLVINGNAAPDLLQTYDSERRPVAERTLAQALSRLAAWFKDPNKRLPPPEEIVDDYAVIFGYLYASGAFVAEDGLPGQAFEDPRQPSGRPGSRAPHVVLERAGEKIAVHDLFGRGFVLLTGADSEAWCDAANRIPDRGALKIDCYRVGAGGDLHDTDGGWLSKYAVSESGAVLVRPDGFIAWRSRDAVADPEKILGEAFRHVLGRQ